MAFPASRKKMMFIIVKMILAFVINIPERVPMILCTFMDIILRVFIYFFPMKKPGNLYIGSKFDFICKLYSWRYTAIKNLQYSVTVSPQVLYLEVCVRECQLRKKFVHQEIGYNFKNIRPVAKMSFKCRSRPNLSEGAC